MLPKSASVAMTWSTCGNEAEDAWIAFVRTLIRSAWNGMIGDSELCGGAAARAWSCGMVIWMAAAGCS